MLEVNACGSSSRLCRRTTVIAHRLACFGQDNTITEDVHPSDVSTIAMESVTPYRAILV